MATQAQGNARLNNYFNLVENFNDKIVANSIGDIRQAYLKAFAEIEQDLLTFVGKFQDPDPIVFRNNVTKYNRLNKLQAQIADKLKSLGVVVNRDVTKGLLQGYTSNYYSSAYVYESTMSTNLNYGLLKNEAVIAGINQYYEFGNYRDSIRMNITRLNQNIRNSVTQGIIQGQSIPKVTKNIKANFDSAFKGAKTIARTEVLRGTSVGQLQSYKIAQQGEDEAGVKLRRYWIQSHTQNPRPEHKDSVVGEEDKDEKFKLISPSQGTVYASGPRLSGVADQDINCHCTTGTKITGIDKSKAFANSDEFISPTEWSKNKNINLERFIGSIVPAGKLNQGATFPNR